VGLARKVITTSSIEAAQGAFAIVQRKGIGRSRYTREGRSWASWGRHRSAGAADDAPRSLPTVGVFAANVTEVAQTVWSGPALATVGLARNVITTSSIEAAQGAFAIVQRRV
jgi:hypothetical protein